jgi:hypothetical protein
MSPTRVFIKEYPALKSREIAVEQLFTEIRQESEAITSIEMNPFGW